MNREPKELLRIEFKRADASASLPERGSDLAAGWDLRSVEDKTIAPGRYEKVRTGLCVALPPGYEMQIRPRSGLAARHGVTVLNAPGTIDADYRGEISVLLINHGQEPFEVVEKMRIAQAIVSQHASFEPVFVSELSETDRGQGGFGSTGVS